MMDLNLICERIAAAAANVTSDPQLHTTSYQPDSVVEPHFMVVEWVINYDRTFRKKAELDVECLLVVGKQDDEGAMQELRRFLSTGNPESIKDAIQAARGGPGQPALGGAADDLWVRQVERPRWYEFSGHKYLGAEIKIKVVE